MKTPYYLIHKDILDEGMRKLKDAVEEYWPNSVIAYSFKTNSLPWVLQYMKEQGCHAEVVSGDEYELAEAMGFQQVIYNGPVKERESFLRALESGQMVNLDAWREIGWLREAARHGIRRKVGIRVNFDLEAMCPGEASAAEEGGRFGFSYENGDFAKALQEVQELLDGDMPGIHLHCSSKTRSLAVYEAIARMACQIRRECGFLPAYLDVGGGYFGGLPDKPQYTDYLRAMSRILQKEYDPEQTALIVEPGTSLISPPVEYVASVTDVKETNRNLFVVTDGSRIHVDPLMTKKSYFYHFEPVCATEAMERRQVRAKQVVCGFTCMENDRLFELRDSPALREGDRIVYEKVGAYTMCLSPLFIGYFPPVYLEEDGRVSCVREKWSAQEYMQRSVLEGKNE